MISQRSSTLSFLITPYSLNQYFRRQNSPQCLKQVELPLQQPIGGCGVDQRACGSRECCQREGRDPRSTIVRYRYGRATGNRRHEVETRQSLEATPICSLAASLMIECTSSRGKSHSLDHVSFEPARSKVDGRERSLVSVADPTDSDELVEQMPSTSSPEFQPACS